MGDDMGEGMQCSDHPYRSNPGGICAFCLQEKLGKLVSSSKSNPFLPAPAPPSSSSSSTSFRSDGGAAGVGGMGGPSSGAASRRTKLPFLSAGGHKTKKKTGGSAGSTSGGGRKASTATAAVSSSSPRPSYNLSIHHGSGNAAVLKRSKSVAPRPAGGLAVESGIMEAVDSPRKKSFWSFLSLTSSSSSSSSSGNRGRSSSSSREGVGGATDCGGRHPRQRQQKGGHARNSSAAAAAVVLARGEAKATATPRADNPAMGVAQEEAEESPNGSQASSSFGRKVARSRSVGCGSRSFSGDFLERISTGFGDCTLRRVESQREAKPKMMLHNHHHHDEQQGFKERVRCGGIFGMISSSPYWLSATADGDLDSSSRLGARGGSTPCGRSRSWSWALASPMRAFRPSSSKPYAIAAAHKAAPANAISSMNNSSVGVGDANTSNKGISSDGSGGDRVGDAPSLLAVRG